MRRGDERVARVVNGHHGHPALDRAGVGLSTFANKGVLWFSIAALLCLTGHRRAAVRGSLSLLAASATANLVVKRMLGGPRPPLETVRHARRLADHPASPSFPSGHSASAFAFATGVTLELPWMGFVLYPLAAAVAATRLLVGAHWASDVVGGATLGSVVAVAGSAVSKPKR